MKPSIAALIVATAVALVASPVLAGDDQSPRSKAESDCARAKKAGKPCQIVFQTGDSVNGGVPGADDTRIYVVGNLPFSSLLRLRVDFIDSIIESADDLP